MTVTARKVRAVEAKCRRKADLIHIGGYPSDQVFLATVVVERNGGLLTWRENWTRGSRVATPIQSWQCRTRRAECRRRIWQDVEPSRDAHRRRSASTRESVPRKRATESGRQRWRERPRA